MGRTRGTWHQGESGNPAGRPPGSPDVAGLARSKGQRMLEVLSSIAEDPKSPPGARVAAASSVLDRGYGRPTEYVEMQQKQLKVLQPSSKQLQRLAEAKLGVLPASTDTHEDEAALPRVDAYVPHPRENGDRGLATKVPGKRVSLHLAQPLGGDGESDESAVRDADRGAGYIVR
jgi:hypothetical protein